MKTRLRNLSSLLRVPPWLQMILRFMLGLAIGVFLHYLLYRISLPVQPFIYVAF